MMGNVNCDSNEYRLEQHRKLHNLSLPPLPDARKDAMADAANLVSEAIADAEAIRDTQHVNYADYQSNPKRNFNDKRPYTLKDARHDAQRATNMLRQAWQILDPCDGVRLTPIDVSRLVNSRAIRTALVELGWRPPQKPLDQPQCPVVAYQHPTSPDCISTDPLAYSSPNKLILKDDVVDHIDWLEHGIDEWRDLAIDCQQRLAKTTTPATPS